MTVSVETPKFQYTGNGSTVAFLFDAKIYEGTVLVVKRLVISPGVEPTVSSK